MIRIHATGGLTEVSQRALHPLIRRARSLTPDIHVTVDCTGAHHVEAAGVELLRWAIDHDDSADGASPVELLVPTGLPAHRYVASPAEPRLEASGRTG